MAEKRVSVRLSATGGRQVRAELEGVGEAGTRGMALRANKRETIDWLKFTLEGAGERTHGYAFTDTTFAGCWI
mgnify:CR=1 FL=1